MGRVFKKLLVAERLCLYMLGFTICLHLILQMRLLTGLGFYLQELRLVVLAYAVALFVAYVINMMLVLWRARGLGQVLTERQVWLDFCWHFLNVETVVFQLRLINVVSLTLVLFNQLKNLTPLVNPNVYDRSLVLSERYLLGGQLAAEYLIDLFGQGSAGLFSLFYDLYYPFLAIVSLLMIMQYRKDLAEEYTAAFVLLWFGGLLLIYLFPTWGPCFFEPQLFQELVDNRSVSMQRALWEGWLQYQRDPRELESLFVISGFPSLHVGVVLLGALYLGKLSRVLLYCSVPFIILTVLSTIYLGWHYVIDDLGSVFCVWLAILITEALFRAERDQLERI